MACFRFGACAPSPCAKCAPNQPKTAQRFTARATGRTPARTGSGPAAGLSIAPLGPSATVLPARLLGLLLAPRLPVLLGPLPAPRLPVLLGPLPVCPPAFARPLATLGNPSDARPSVTPLLPLGVRLCPCARLPHRRRPPRPRLDRPKRKADRSPMERPAPRRSICPYALGPVTPVYLAPQRLGGGIGDICHQPPRVPRIDVARQLRNG